MSSIGRCITTHNLSPDEFMRLYHSIYTTMKFVRESVYYSYRDPDANAAIGAAMLTLTKEVRQLHDHTQELRQRVWELDSKDQLITGQHYRESPLAMREAVQQFAQGDIETHVG